MFQTGEIFIERMDINQIQTILTFERYYEMNDLVEKFMEED